MVESLTRTLEPVKVENEGPLILNFDVQLIYDEVVHPSIIIHYFIYRTPWKWM